MSQLFEINRITSVNDIIRDIPLERLAEICEAERDGRCVVLPKESHQPMFVKMGAVDTLDQWNDITGALEKGTSWYYEAQTVVEEVAAMAFGAGIFYESERSKTAAEAALKGESNER